MAHFQRAILVTGILLLISSSRLNHYTTNPDSDPRGVLFSACLGSRLQLPALWDFAIVAVSGFPLNTANTPVHHGTRTLPLFVHDVTGSSDPTNSLPKDGFVELKVGASDDEEGAGEFQEDGSEHETAEAQNQNSSGSNSERNHTEEEKASEAEEVESREEQPVEAKPPKVKAQGREEVAAPSKAPSMSTEPFASTSGRTSMVTSSLANFMPSLAFSDGEELCNSISCTKVLQGTPPKAQIKGCRKSIKCSQCKEGGVPEGVCESWKAPRQPEVLLRAGQYNSQKVISRHSSLDLSLKWDSSSPLDVSGCLPDLKQLALATDELATTGNVNPTRFHRLLNMTVAVQRFSAEGHEGKHGFPRISLSLKSNLAPSPTPGLSASGFYPVCPANLYESPMITLAHREAAVATSWFSIPLDYSAPITPSLFSLRVVCRDPSECPLSQMSFCIRLSCPVSNVDAEKQLKALKNAMQHPVGMPEERNVAKGRAVVPGTSGALPGTAPRVQQLAASSRYAFRPIWWAAAAPLETTWFSAAVAIAVSLLIAF